MKSFYQKIKKYSHLISFHTPGHSGRLPQGLLKTDITELFYSDNLLEPKNEIRDLEKTVAKAYVAQRAFISVNGATNSIMTAIYCLKDKGGFLALGDCHSSVFNALRIFNCDAYHMDDIENVEDIPEQVKTVIITSPDYFGVCADIKRYKELIKDRYIILDMSHGSHFIYSQKKLFEDCSLCDLVVCSLHKTMPVTTGGAVLLSYNRELNEKCLQARKLLHSSSPSYITLASISRAFSLFEKKGNELYEKVLKKIKQFKKKARNIGVNFLINDDYTRLVLISEYEGSDIYNALVEEGIAAEMSYLNKVVFIVTPFNYKYLAKLYRKLKTIMKKDMSIFSQAQIKNHIKVKKLEFAKEYEVLDIGKAAGKKAYREIGIYPPGTPLIRAGEEITLDILDIVSKNKDKCFGLENGGIAVISYKDGGKR